VHEPLAASRQDLFQQRLVAATRGKGQRVVVASRERKQLGNGTGLGSRLQTIRQFVKRFCVVGG
jgi:nucleotidyltransferase/DNA polymerase involved in DNA repair